MSELVLCFGIRIADDANLGCLFMFTCCIVLYHEFCSSLSEFDFDDYGFDYSFSCNGKSELK